MINFVRHSKNSLAVNRHMTCLPLKLVNSKVVSSNLSVSHQAILIACNERDITLQFLYFVC